MLTNFLSVYKEFLSRAFWLGSFLPVLSFATVHAVLASLVFPGQVNLFDWLTDDKASPAKLIPTILAGLVVLAWALAPLIPIVRGLLDGALLPPRLLNALRQERIDERRFDFDRALDQVTRTAARWQRLLLDAREQLIGAHRRGERAFDANVPTRLPEAEAGIESLAYQSSGGRSTAIDVAKAATDLLADALEHGAGYHVVGGELREREDVLALWQKQLRLLKTSGDEAVKQRDDLVARRDDNPMLYFRATRVGDVREKTEAYSRRTYGVDFDFLWPRIQLYLSKDEPLSQRLVDAQAVIDFGILSLALALTVPLVWLPLLALVAASPWLFLALGLASPTLIAVINLFIVQAETAFGSIVETAIDKYRLDVLTGLLRQPTPSSRKTERALWRAVALADDPDTGGTLSYWPPTK